MKYRVNHRTSYAYQSPVDLGAHMLHLQPRALARQTVLTSALHCDPAPSAMRTGQDCFGNTVAWLFIETHHSALHVTLDATVDVQAPDLPVPADTPPWQTVPAAAMASFEAAEFLFDSPMAPAIPEARDYAEASFRPGRPVMDALIDLNDRIGRDMVFRAGATTIGTTVAQVLAGRQGVCQDFSHLMIACLRAQGLPARYVSGYIRTKPPPGKARLRGADRSHAWVGCWLGPSHGWIDIDPTNGVLIGDEHVVLGWGRDFSDVSPLCGVILGGGSHTLEVSVDLEPAEADA